ncbi:hypothetical protein AAG570_000380 [Ranatra chinensis]|uniref:Uncharacterized protein n=1 Tax=Ranatra chinensis TaxID=642074 RepID=A0ABD0YWV9_9HEMI
MVYIFNNARLVLCHIPAYDEFSLYPVLAENVAGLVGEDGLNALFLNATYNTESPSEMGELTYDTLMIPLKVNTISPIMLTKALLPLLKKAAEVNSSLPIGVHRAAIIFMSSIYGSINSNHTGRWWGFRESKVSF